MTAFLDAFRAALRAAAWRGSDRPVPPPSAAHLVVLVVAMAAMTALQDWAVSGADSSFQLYGVNALIATEAATFAVVALFASRRSASIELFVLSCLFLIAGAVLLTTILLGLVWKPTSEAGTSAATVLGWAGIVAFGVCLLWLIGAIRRVLLSVEGAGARHPTPRAFGVVLGLYAVVCALPQWPLFTGDDFQRTTANLYEYVSAARASKVKVKVEADAARSEWERKWAEIELEQPALLDSALTGLATRWAGEPNLFVVGVAGWSDQDVFLSEIKGSLGVLDARFGTGGRTVRLVNHAETNFDAPLASLPNLAATLRGVAERMDRERDALVLVLTSHGSRSGFALNFYPLVSRTLSPDGLKSALDKAGIKNRVVVVSACHSGVFVPALADEHSVVITASSAERSSFGCSNEREWTHFGDAFFNHAVREGGSVPEAFAKARELIAAWETREGLTPSEPQMHVGSAIRALFPTLLGQPDHAQARTGDAVPGQELVVR